MGQNVSVKFLTNIFVDLNVKQTKFFIYFDWFWLWLRLTFVNMLMRVTAKFPLCACQSGYQLSDRLTSLRLPRLGWEVHHK